MKKLRQLNLSLSMKSESIQFHNNIQQTIINPLLHSFHPHHIQNSHKE